METDQPASPVASTSAIVLEPDAVEGSEGVSSIPSEAGRARRSRKNRPCDLCRQKHQCIIPVKGEPCKTCKQRSRPCTFNAPPVLRIRKPKVDGGDPAGSAQPNESMSHSTSAGPGRSAAPRARASGSPTYSNYDSPSASASGSAALLSLIRSAKTAPARPSFSPSTSAPEVMLARADGQNALHYISTQAFSDLTFSVEEEHTAVHPGDISFRQVSNDAAMPVFFVSTPTLMYGTAAPAGQRLWQAACGVLAEDAPARLIDLYLRQTQPAFPILDTAQFSSSDPAQLARNGVSYGLLTSLLGHSTCYVFEIRSQHKHLWRQVLLALEDEYRKPTLQTLQLALITITSRPAINVSQNVIAMGRLIGAAQLLGLHLDPTDWRIPRSERIIRKRVWWAILISDKWRSALYGRPSNISLQDCSVPLPTMDDVDANAPLGEDAAASFESFIAMCKLTLILDNVLINFFTVRAISSPRPPEARLEHLETLSAELAELEIELPTALRSLPGEEGATHPAPTGIRSFQLCKLGVQLMLYRLTVAAIPNPTTAQQAASFRTALALVQTIVEFLENLAMDEYGQFWSPYCSFVISNAGALLLRTALTARSCDQTTRTTCGVFFTRLVVALTSSHHSSRWDVASLALDRIATLLHSLNGELPELVPLLQLFGPPNHASNDHPPDPAPMSASPTIANPVPLVSPSLPQSAPFSTPPLHHPSLPSTSIGASHSAPQPAPHSTFAGPLEDHLTSPSDQANPLWWMQTEILSMPEHFGDLGDVFEGWEAGTAGSGGGEGMAEGVVGQGGEGADIAEGGEGQEEVFDLLRFLQGPAGGA